MRGDKCPSVPYNESHALADNTVCVSVSASIPAPKRRHLVACSLFVSREGLKGCKGDIEGERKG